MTIFESRKIYNKESIASFNVANLAFFDVKHITALELSQIQHVLSTLRRPRVKLSWLKGDKLTVIIGEESAPAWADLLDDMGIIVNPDAKLSNLPKRLARLFSPRDVVAKITTADLNELFVNDDEFFRAQHLDLADKHHMPLDGPMAIKESFAYRLGKDSGITRRAIRRAEGLSMSILTPQGMIKAFAYVVADDKWAYGAHNIVSGRENLKLELLSKGNLVYVAYDVFQHYADPKSNALLDVALGHMLYRSDASNMLNALHANLEMAFDAIKKGELTKKLDLWSLPELGFEMNGTLANEDFAMLSGMAKDWTARGLDIRYSPTLVSMYITAAERQYWNQSKDWPRYPIICAWNRPVITESAACMIGEAVTVEHGEIRAIRNGDVWVVNDHDWMHHIAFNWGGADGDDHELLVFRSKNGERGVLVPRIPMGPSEFEFFRFHDGDPFPSFTDPLGRVVEFPELPGEIGETVSEKVANGTMNIIELPVAEPLQFPEKYGPEFIEIVLVDLMENSTGHLGQAINRVVLAMSVDHELLNTNYGMETMIDTFTKGGAGVSRTIISDWANDLVSRVAEAPAVDAIMWDKRSGNPTDITPKRLVKGFWSKWYDSCVAERKAFVMKARAWHYQWLVQNNQLLAATAGLFNLSPYGVQDDQSNPMITVAKLVLSRTKNEQKNLNENAHRENRTLTAEEWRSLYEFTHNLIIEMTGGDEAGAELLTVAVWVVAMTAKSNPNDKVIMNAVNYETFMRGLVRFGIAADTRPLFSYLSWDKEMDIETNMDDAYEASIISEWAMRCPHCHTEYNTTDVRSYVRYLLSEDQKCIPCRRAS